MIRLTKLTKEYGNRKILDRLSIDFPRAGLVAILGASGSGKTTLLNILALLDEEYSGLLLFDGINPRELNPSELPRFCLHNISLVFQDFNLLRTLSLEDNLDLPTDIGWDMDIETKRKRNKHYQTLLDLKIDNRKAISNMSGGEQQRLAIIRSINSDSRIVLLDEPTGSLDERTGRRIFKFLKGISKKKLVIIASHDGELVEDYADHIVKLEESKCVVYQNEKSKNDVLSQPLIKNTGEKTSPTLPLKTIYQQYRGGQKNQAIRSKISSFVTSISLFCVGASLLLTNSISSGITNVLKDSINPGSIIMNHKSAAPETIMIESASFSAVQEIKKNYGDDIINIMPYYHNNFEDMFKDYNSISLDLDGASFVFDCYQIRDVASFRLLQDVDIDYSFYPYRPPGLTDDEVVIALPSNYIDLLCLRFQIERNYISLGRYITEKGMKIILDVENHDWGYSDQQVFNVTAIVNHEIPGFFHSNPLWSEVILESMMLFPSSLSLNKVEQFPWTLKKTYLMNVHDVERFLYMSRVMKNLALYLFESQGDSKLLVYYNNSSSSLSYDDYLTVSAVNNKIGIPIYSTYGFYGVFGANILSGFTKPFFLSASPEKSDIVVDTITSLNLDSEDFFFSDNEQVAQGYFLNQQNGLKFEPLFIDKIVKGRKPEKMNEIIISKGLAELIGVLSTETTIYSDFVSKETKSEGVIYREIERTTLSVVGFTDSSKILMYQDPFWILNYPLLYYRMSPFLLLPHNLTFTSSLTSKDSAEVIESLNAIFSQYVFTNPLHDIAKSIENVTNSFQTILLIFAAITFILAIIFLIVSVYLCLTELKRELGLLRVNGASENQCRKLIVFNCLFRIAKALALSFVELLIMSFALSYVMKDVLNSSFMWQFDFYANGLMFLAAFLTFALLSFVMLLRFKNLKSVKLLKF